MPEPAAQLNSLEQKLKDASPGSLPYYGMLTSTIGNLRTSTERATAAFSAGDTLAGAGGVIEMASSLMPLGALLLTGLGPVGVTISAFIGAMFDLTGAVLSAYAPQRKTLAQEIAGELEKFRVAELKEALSAADHSYERALAAYLAMEPATRSWEEIQATLNHVDGVATNNLDIAKEWLKTHLDSDAWPEVFGKYWYVVSLRTQAFVSSVGKLRTDTDALAVGLSVQTSQITWDKDFAHLVHRDALNAGTVWHVGNNRSIYERVGLTNERKWKNTSRQADDVAVIGSNSVLFRFDRAAHQVSSGDSDIFGYAAASSSGEPLDSQAFCLASTLTAAQPGACIFIVAHGGGNIFWGTTPMPPVGRVGGGSCSVSGGKVLAIQAVSPAEGQLLVFLLVDTNGKRSVLRYSVTTAPAGANILPVILNVETLQANGAPAPNAQFVPRGIAIGREHVYAHSEWEIFRARIGTPAEAWNEDWSGVTQLQMGSGATIKSLSVSGDGQVLAVLSNEEIRALFENVQPDSEGATPGQRETVWLKVPDAQAIAAVKAQVENHQLFRQYLHCCDASADAAAHAAAS